MTCYPVSVGFCGERSHSYHEPGEVGSSGYLENIRAGMEAAMRTRDRGMVVSYSLAFGEYLRAKGRFTELLRVSERGLSAAQSVNDFELVALSQNKMGNAYGTLPTGDRGANLKQAIAYYEAALRGFKAAGLTEEAGRVTQILALLKEQ